MRGLAFLITLTGFLASGISAAAGLYNGKCSQFSNPVPFNYCVYKPVRNGSKDFVYYLHGSSLNVQTWAEHFYYTAQIRSVWRQEQIKLPTVISISFGPTWLLANKNSSRSSGLLDALTKIYIPKIEAALGGLKGRRLVFGESMGGFNTAQLALKTSLFKKAAILCAPMATVSPFANESVIMQYIQHSGAWQYYSDDHNVVIQSVNNIISLLKAFYPTQLDWNGGDPLVLASKVDPKTAPKLYVSDGYYDQYVAYEGNEAFVSELQKRGIPVEWHPQWGGHCAIDINSLARFLTN